jgi:carboxymethylenebutenolidase
MTMIEIPVAGRTTEAWLSRPDDQTHPGVLLYVDAIGLRPEIGRIADRIASWGYVVLAPNVFHRTGTADELAPPGPLIEDGAREAFFQTVRPRAADLTNEALEADSDDYLAALRATEGVASGPFGMTGYCLGVRLAVRTAARHAEHFAAVGGFHGGNLVTDKEDSPHLLLPRTRAAFVFGHADNDSSMAPAAVATLGEALGAAGLEHSNTIYPGSPHGYTMSDTSMYDETGAERHFSELRELLAAKLS